MQTEFQDRLYLKVGAGDDAQWVPAIAPVEEDAPLPPPPSRICRQVPDRLYVRGRPGAFELLRWLPDKGFAVVGTRRPQERSLRLLRDRMEDLRGSGLIILSGLALGIDAAAHEAALAARLPTVAILAGGLDRVYPSENRDLARRIVSEGGLLVTEFAPGTRIEPHFFLQRNRIIAAWSMATWVVEAGVRSGALNTASWASGHSRDTYATPCFPGDPAHAGNQNLIYKKKAEAFWETGSLTETWKELRTIQRKRANSEARTLWDLAQYNDQTSKNDASSLKKEVERATLQLGGLAVEGLLDWATQRKWNPQRFFDALRACLELGQIRDNSGILTSVAPGDRVTRP